ncbi:Imm1 family immunity protein [Comamonas sp. CMM02]|uniref:Imm1 family immunity protein n=1 Tax=Comamonas sp. CMM02 TaxID=2769307 RepID=UPI00177D42C3|nr:Imm1 family immunity protein [Comamonas sp. CMM02]MBD9402816.1 hypothetical protein [Comamonas sp. CMM02]
MKLIIDSRIGVHGENEEILDASVDVAFAWLKKLNGKERTLLNIDRLDGSNLMIGGGPSWYIVVLNDGRNNLTLKNSHGLEAELIELCAGGQYGEYPKSMCVDEDQVQQVVRQFFEGKEDFADWV